MSCSSDVYSQQSIDDHYYKKGQNPQVGTPQDIFGDPAEQAEINQLNSQNQSNKQQDVDEEVEVLQLGAQRQESNNIVDGNLNRDHKDYDYQSEQQQQEQEIIRFQSRKVQGGVFHQADERQIISQKWEQPQEVYDSDFESSIQQFQSQLSQQSDYEQIQEHGLPQIRQRGYESPPQIKPLQVESSPKRGSKKNRPIKFFEGEGIKIGGDQQVLCKNPEHNADEPDIPAKPQFIQVPLQMNRLEQHQKNNNNELKHQLEQSQFRNNLIEQFSQKIERKIVATLNRKIDQQIKNELIDIKHLLSKVLEMNKNTNRRLDELQRQRGQ